MRVRLRSLVAPSVLAACWLALPRVLAAGVPQGNADVVEVPTLGGIGLGLMAGILAMGGAWAVSRNRDRRGK